MSTATIPFSNRPGFFPGALSEEPSSKIQYDYIVLDETDGDAGLREAMRIWWMIERFTMTPAGTLNTSTKSRSFARVYQLPNCLGVPDQSSGSARGSILARTSGGSLSSLVPVEPARRSACSVNQVFSSVYNYFQFFDEGSPEGFEQGQNALYILFESGEWRLYYRFQYNIGSYEPSPDPLDPPVVVGLFINNNALFSGTPLGSGSFSFLGYTFPYVYYAASADMSYFDSATGVGLSASDVEWTF
jgi:hypothetical protein